MFVDGFEVTFFGSTCRNMPIIGYNAETKTLRAYFSNTNSLIDYPNSDEEMYNTIVNDDNDDPYETFLGYLYGTDMMDESSIFTESEAQKFLDIVSR